MLVEEASAGNQEISSKIGLTISFNRGGMDWRPPQTIKGEKKTLLQKTESKQRGWSTVLASVWDRRDEPS